MMIPPILAKLSAHPAFADALNFILTGLALVLGALLLLSGLISAIGKAFRRAEEKKKPAPPMSHPPITTEGLPSTAVAATGTTSPVDDDTPLAALIAAAVHVALDGKAHRVVHIEPVSVGWAREGRREIFSSHRFR